LLIFGNFFLYNPHLAHALDSTSDVRDYYATDRNDNRNDNLLLDAGLAIGATVAKCIVKAYADLFLMEAMRWLSDKLSEWISSFTGGILSLEVPVKDASIRAKETGNGLTSLPPWDSIATCLVESMLRDILVSMTQWVKNGANGKPMFLENPGAFFRNISDRDFGTALDELIDDVDLCSNFKIRITASLLINWQSKEKPKDCRLSTILGEDGAVGGGVVQQFTSGDFAKGGWRSWFTLTQANDPYDDADKLSQRAQARIEAEKNTWAMNLTWGSGFMNIRDKDGNVITPGQMIQQKISNITGIPYDRLALADEFNELIFAIIDEVVKESFGAAGLGDIAI